MSHLGADWLDRPERNAEEQPDKALDAIGVRPGDVVADVGAGTGYYTVKLASRVQPGGRVYATDIQPEMLEKLRVRLAAEKIGGVEPVLAHADNTGLPVHALDLILLVDVTMSCHSRSARCSSSRLPSNPPDAWCCWSSARRMRRCHPD